ncbi:hypothetical protein CSQ89_08660 [Chitinimonas sp. BJB300]|nr:hypothetical protein CSQ89_08660 [Chitinimonas sp. BJB300]
MGIPRVFLTRYPRRGEDFEQVLILTILLSPYIFALCFVVIPGLGRIKAIQAKILLGNNE